VAQTKTSSPGEGVKAALQDTMSALGERAMQGAKQRVTGLTDKMTDYADGNGAGSKVAAKAAEEATQGGSPVKGAVKGALSAGKDKVAEALPGKGGGGKRKPPAATKAMNFVESIDVGVPAKVAFNQWTQYDEWPSFMKKVEQADLDDSDEPKVKTKLHVFWFRRTQESTIQDQIPDERILWRSNGQKGHVDGCVSFHEIGPRLTRILVTLEYYPKGFVERVGNIWRAQGRRLRLELKHFRRHVMMSTILSPDDAEGWRGEVEDGEVIRTHDEVVDEESQADEHSGEDDGQNDEERDEQDREGRDQADEPDEDGEPQDESAEPEDQDEEPEDEEPEDEGDEEPSDEFDEQDEDEPVDEQDEDEPVDEQDEDEPVDEQDEDEPVDEQDEDEPADEPQEEEPADEPAGRTRRRQRARR